MNIVLLSGGSGKRLWPLSNDIRSKQFIKLFKNEKDEYKSMVQRIYAVSYTHLGIQYFPVDSIQTSLQPLDKNQSLRRLNQESK